MHRAEVPPDHPLVELLERFQVTPRSDVGRNDPCWCGSGRKYKKCHLHNERLSLDERAAWLRQTVHTGQLIAEIGNRGHPTGPHLHFQIESGGQPIDPRTYYQQHNAPPLCGQ